MTIARQSLATSKTLARKANYSILDLLARNAPQEDQEKLLSALGGGAEEAAAAAETAKERQGVGEGSTMKTGATTQAETETETRHHALLGQELADLGYKRVYLCSVGSLADLPVWEKQRVFREARSRNIAKDLGKRVRHGFVTLPGVITLIKKGGFVEEQPSLEDERASLAVVDGQHRIGALAMLAAEGKLDASLPRVIVEVFPDNEGEGDEGEGVGEAAGATKKKTKKTTSTTTKKKKNAYASQIFADINKAEPVKLVDLPDSSGGASEVQKEALSLAVESLSGESDSGGVGRGGSSAIRVGTNGQPRHGLSPSRATPQPRTRPCSSRRSGAGNRTSTWTTCATISTRLASSPG